MDGDLQRRRRYPFAAVFDFVCPIGIGAPCFTLRGDAVEVALWPKENINAIQRCYERELIRKPGLSGKIQVEWVVATSGAVRTARQAFSNLDSSDVSNCILSAIRGWRFPQPKGGEVIVNYPFIFKSIGF